MSNYRALKRMRFYGCVLSVAILALSDACTALTINLTYTPNTPGEPVNDPNGVMLQSIMRAAADAWEDIILDSHTMTINYYYVGSLPNDALADALDLDDVNSRVTEGQIRVNGPGYDWYLDPNPGTDLFKYEFTQTLYRDLTAQQQTDWFNGDVPDFLEVGYRGTALPGMPPDMHDLYSTVVHEIGHLVGVPGSKNFDTGSMTDGEYDFDPAFVGGNVMAAYTDDLTPDEANDLHLAARLSLMCRGCGAANLRRRITATDVLAAQSTANWNQIDLPRKEFIGGDFDSYNDAANWIGNRVPDSQDVVNFHTAGIHGLTADGDAGDLFLYDGSELVTWAHTLDASDSLNIIQTGAEATVLYVSNGGRAEADDLNIDGGLLNIDDGFAVGYDLVKLSTNGAYTGEVSGHGTLGAPDWLINDGIIRAVGGTLTIMEDSLDLITPTWLLDGDHGHGQLVAIDGDLVIDGPVGAPFDGHITVGADRSITFMQDWTLDEGGDGNVGEVDLNGTSVTAAAIDGPGELSVSGLGIITVDKLAHINAPVQMNDNAWLHVPNADDVLVFNDTTTLSGGTLSGSGTVVQNGDVVVQGNVMVSPETYDWDGESDDTTTTIINGTMTLDVPNLGDDGADTFRGTVTVGGGTLEVTQLAQWTMDGTMILSTGLGSIPGEVTGDSDMIVTGALNVIDAGIISADTVLTSLAQINVPDADDTLTLDATVEFQGGPAFDGAINGDGVVKANGNINVTGNFQVNTGVYDWDGDTESTAAATTIFPGVSLTINAPAIEPGGAGDVYDGLTTINGGTLEVNTGYTYDVGGVLFFNPTAWTLGANGKLELNESGGTPATVDGSPIDIYGEVDVSGNAVINNTITTRSTSDVTVGSGGVLTINNPIMPVDYRGGSFTGQGTIVHNGYIHVNEPTTISVALIDLDGPSDSNHVRLNSPLTLDADTLFANGTTTFAGNMDIYPGGSFNWDQTVTGMIVTGRIDLFNTGLPEQTMMTVPSVALLGGGVLDVNGEVAIDGAVSVLSTGSLLLDDPQDVLHLLGNDVGIAMQIVGTTLSGDGVLKVSGSNLIHGHGEIAVDIDFGNSTSLEAAAATLTLSGDVINAGSIGTQDNAAVLNTPGLFSTANVQQVNLQGGKWEGGTINHSSLLAGYGKVATAAFNNDGSIEPSGGTLLISLYDPGTGTTQVPDLDGTSGAGQVLLHNGSMEVRGVSGLLPFDGGLEVYSGQQFVMPTGGLDLGGSMRLYGGAYDAPQLTINGTVSIPGNHPASHIYSDVVITGAGELTGSSAVRIIGSLEFDQDNAVSSTTYSKGGATSIGQVIMEPSSTLTGSANQTVNLTSFGTVQIGDAWDTLVVNSYQHRSGAVLKMQIGGELLNSEFDQLIATDFIDLDQGTLELKLNGTHRYRIGDAFVILQASNGLTGAFESAVLGKTSLMGLGLIYDANSVTARFQRLGDLNFDGFVGLDDLDVVLGAWNQNVDAGVWGAGDFDGDGFVGLGDLDIVLNNWNTGTPPGEVLANIPEPATIALLGVAGLLWMRRHSA